MDELLLVEAAQRGEVESFNQLVLRYQTAMYNLAYRLLSDRAAAADLTQEAFISAYHALRSFRGSNFRAWLARIVTNACYDELRRRRRRPSVSIEDLAEDRADSADQPVLISDPDESPEAQFDRRDLLAAIEGCLQSLPPSFRTVAILSDVQHYAYDEIALALNLSLGTVKSRLSRARSKLRECLQGFQELLPSAFRQEKQELLEDDTESA